MRLSESEAKTKRRSIKATATRLRNFIEFPQAQHVSKFELIERRKKLASLFEQYDEVQSRIEVLTTESDSSTLATHAEDRARFEEAYFELMSLYDQHINLLEQPHSSSRSNNNDSNQFAYQNYSDSHIRLPKIQLPIFLGLYEDWYTFCDLFEKLIHTNERLSAIQKFHYLRSFLKDKAAEVVRHYNR